MNNNNSITSARSALWPEAAKYSTFRNRILDLPHTLCANFLYDGKGVDLFSAKELGMEKPFHKKGRARFPLSPLGRGKG